MPRGLDRLEEPFVVSNQHEEKIADPDGDGLAGGHMEVDVVQDVQVAVIGEVQVIGHDFTPDVGERLGVGRVAEVGLGAHQLGEPLETGQTHGVLLGKAGQLADGGDKGADVEAEGDQVDVVELPVHNQEAAHSDGHGGSQVRVTGLAVLGDGHAGDFLHVSAPAKTLSYIVALFAHGCEKRVVVNSFEHGVYARHDHGVSAESRAVVRIAQNIRRFFANQHGAHRQPAAKSFGKGGYIGLHAEHLRRQKPARSAHAALNFVGDDQHVLFAAHMYRR